MPKPDMLGESRLDADEQIFFSGELRKIKSKSYDVRYPEFKCRTLIPVSYDAGPGAEEIGYDQYDMVGAAKIINNYATDFNRVDVKGKRFVSRVKSIGDSYGYNIQEIRAARMANKPLEQRRANAARQATVITENNIAYFGDAEYNLGGFLTNPNIPVASVLADGAGASGLWVNKTPDQIIRDMNACANSVFENTKQVESANVLLLPPKQYTLVSSTRMGQGSDMTILEFFLKANQYIKVVDWLGALDKDSNTIFESSIMVAYNRHPDNLTLEIPVDFEQFPPQPKGMDYEIDCHERIGGVIVYYPLTVSIYDGIA